MSNTNEMREFKARVSNAGLGDEILAAVNAILDKYDSLESISEEDKSKLDELLKFAEDAEELKAEASEETAVTHQEMVGALENASEKLSGALEKAENEMDAALA